MVADDYSHLAGHRFPGGTYTLDGYVSWLWEDCILADHDAQVAHPSLGYFIAMGGIGVSIGEIMALLDGSPDSGVMFGENELDLRGALRPGSTYECAGEIVSVERKSGRRAGTFDKLLFRIEVREQGRDDVLVVCTSSWIFPRGGGDG